MKIRFEETLGFIPVQRVFEADLNDLPEEIRSHILDLNESHQTNTSVPDEGFMMLRVRDGNKTRTINNIGEQDKNGILLSYLRKNSKPVPLD